MTSMPASFYIVSFLICLEWFFLWNTIDKKAKMSERVWFGVFCLGLTAFLLLTRYLFVEFIV